MSYIERADEIVSKIMRHDLRNQEGIDKATTVIRLALRKQDRWKRVMLALRL